MYHYEELSEKGWQKSLVSGESVDGNGPAPWVTYPALRFIERLVSPQLKVFETVAEILPFGGAAERIPSFRSNMMPGGQKRSRTEPRRDCVSS